MALSEYDKSILSEEDQRKIELAKQAWGTAKSQGDKAGMMSASERAETIRRAYGYSGGTDGNQYVPLTGSEGAEKIQGASEKLDNAYAGVNNTYTAQAEASKADINKERDTMLKQLYIGNMMDQKNINQQLKAGGVTGGMSESSRLSMQQGYRSERNAANTAALEAKKDVDLSTQSAIAQNELNRANAEYNADVTAAQFENTAAATKRNNELTEKQLQQNEEQLALSKYTSFIQNGLVDESNAKKIATSIGASESSVLAASKAAQNADYASMALNLLSAGIYDENFVSLLGGRFSAETLKEYANQNKLVFNAELSSLKGSSGSSSSGSDDTPLADMSVYAAYNNYGENFDDTEWGAAAQTYGMSVSEVKAAFAQAKADANKGTDESITQDTTLNEMLKKNNMDVALWKDYAAEYNYGVGLSASEIREMARKFGVSSTEMMMYLNLARGGNNE